MKKFEQKVLKFRIASMDNADSVIGQAISEKGNEGFRVINSFLYHAMQNGKHEYLYVIMEREI